MMRVNRHRKVLAALAALLCVVAAFALTARASGQDEGMVKLEGAWIARVVQGPLGQWEYTLSPDPSGRTAALNGAVVVHHPGTPTASDLAPVPIFGEIVKTGPDTASANVFFHVVHNNLPQAVGRVQSTARFLSPGVAEVTSRFDFYLQGPDGLPTGNPLPGLSFTTVSLDTRVPSPVQ